jgi:centractin
LFIVLTSCLLGLYSIGRPKHPKIMATDFDEKEVYIGRRAQELRGLLKIKWPVEHGIVSFNSRIVVVLVELTRGVGGVGDGHQVTDWDDMERIWNYVYREGLGTASEEVSRFHTTHLLNFNIGSDLSNPYIFSTPSC